MPVDDAAWDAMCQAAAKAWGARSPDSSLRQHWIEQGERAGYPDCCVDFFSNVWVPWLSEERRGRSSWASEYHRALVELGWEGNGRIWCPRCAVMN
jgi:hypothetical protein